MLDFVIIFLITALTGLLSYLIFCLTVKQSPAINFSIQDTYQDVVVVIHRLEVDFAKTRVMRLLVGFLTFWFYFFRLKYRNFFGGLDATLVQLLCGVMIVFSAVNGWDLAAKIFDWAVKRQII